MHQSGQPGAGSGTSRQLPASDPSIRLDGWKVIASYFGRDMRTVMRWETSRGLPVRRLPGAARSTVFAYAGELAAWSDIPNSPPLAKTGDVDARPLRAIGLGTAAIAVTLILANPRRAARIALGCMQVIASDQAEQAHG